MFHDDQHGTAIIVAAGLLNALDITGRKIHEIKVVFSGAGAAGIGCAELLVRAGVPRERIWLAAGAEQNLLLTRLGVWAIGSLPAERADIDLTGRR